MPKSTNTCNSLLALLFNATAFANIADNAASAPATNLYLSLHTATPGVGGSQLTNETAYTNYARIAVARTTGGWAVPSAGGTSNAALAQFAQCGASGATITHVAIGTASSGAGTVLYAGALNASLTVSNLIQPQFAIGALTVAET
jgi:hypothetical protein